MANIKDKDDTKLKLSLLRAILLVLLDSREDPDRKIKPEILLYRAGLNSKEIAELLGKKDDAVRKTIYREK